MSAETFGALVQRVLNETGAVMLVRVDQLLDRQSRHCRDGWYAAAVHEAGYYRYAETPQAALEAAYAADPNEPPPLLPEFQIAGSPSDGGRA